MKFLLDTSAYVGFKLGYQELVDCIACANTIYISPIVLGELVFGFRNGTRFNENMEELNHFLSHEAVETIHISNITADRYSRIASQLRTQGTPIPSNDIWIAAQTMEFGAELITMDKHFEKVVGIVYRLFSSGSSR